MLIAAVLPRLLIGELPSWLDATIFHNPLVRMPEFALGILLALLDRDLAARASQSGVARLAASALGCAGYLLVSQLTFLLTHQPLQSAAAIPFYALLVWGLATNTGVLARLLSLPALVLLGEASYSLYLLHIPVYAALAGLNLDLAGPAYAGYLAAAISASLVMYLLLERPLRRWILARGTGAVMASRPGRDAMLT